MGDKGSPPAKKVRKTDSGIFEVSTATRDATQAIREQKVVKSDDAEVPEHLWEDHLFEKSGWAEKWSNHRESFQKACSILKARMLCWWKRTVTRSLNNWVDCRYPHVREKFYDTNPIVERAGRTYAWLDKYGQTIYSDKYAYGRKVDDQLIENGDI